MKTKMILTMALLLLCLPLTTHSQELRGKIQRSVKELKTVFPQISKEKIQLLDQLAARMVSNMGETPYTVVFVDQDNDDMGQLAMIWLRTGLMYYGLYDRFKVESAGLDTANETLPGLALLKNDGFRVSNAQGESLFTYSVRYGSDSWTINRKTLESLHLDEDSSVKVYVQDGLTDRNAEVLFENKAVIAGEMIYVATQVDAIIKAKMNNP
ncbi:hypothetical protein EZV76_07420 [Flagellimonas alvinocaridis]|uniref:DUF4251 domain-containing protein n=1 Tax=Flagellimonas alvinocaridis TaxID=2530200 RepID=A0A4V4HXB1_9FLAO|nr:hypothetical protein [Allomuricauda alvinocaridis]THV60376.1 hypothetical protein EZV76_07420 [Allomuricauda alvinocaridis]